MEVMAVLGSYSFFLLTFKKIIDMSLGNFVNPWEGGISQQKILKKKIC